MAEPASPGKVYFYLPPGSFTSFDLLSIVYKSARSLSLTVEFGESQSAAFPAPSCDCGVLRWSTDDTHNFTQSRVRTFAAVLDPEVRIDVNLDQIVLVSVDDAFHPASQVLLFRFLAGWFARSCDSVASSIRLSPGRPLSAHRRESIQKACEAFQETLPAFDSASSGTFAAHFEQQESVARLRRQLNVEQFEQYREGTKGTPPIGGLPQTVRPKKSGTAYPTPRPKKRLGGNKGASLEASSGAIFPRDRDGWRAPSLAEIQMCIGELALIFPWDLDARSFCGIGEDDLDPDTQRTFLFNVIHLLVLVAEFTGTIYDVRISMADGWYKLEDRLTGAEIRRDTITAKTIQSNPYRLTVLACLRKVASEFRLDPGARDFINYIDAILRFPTQLRD